jgi:hypothetical protein
MKTLKRWKWCCPPCKAPATYVKRVTALKLAAASAGSAQLPDARCCARIPPLCFGRRIYGKFSADADDAPGHVVGVWPNPSVLNGRGGQPCDPDDLHLETTSVSRVSFAEMSPAQIGYVDTGEPMGGGCVCRREAAAMHIRQITGYSGIIMDCCWMKQPSCYRAAGLTI